MGDKQMTRADAVERASEAYRLRVEGATWRTVADVVGFTDPANAHRAVRRFLGALPRVDVEESRTIARERAEALWFEALADVRSRRPGAVRAAVAVLARMAALDGLDVSEPIRRDPAPDELDEFVATILRASGREPIVEGDVFAIVEVESPRS